MTTRRTRRLVLAEWGESGENDAARVLDQAGTAVAVVAEPVAPGDVEALRDAIIARVLDQDFGDTVLAGVAFAHRWGGDAVGFT